MTSVMGKQRQLAEDNAGGGLMSSYSQWGPSFEAFMATDVSAPGADILTTYPIGLDSGYRIVSDTSFSAPFAASVAALIAEVRNTTDWKVLSSLIATTAKPLARTKDGGGPGNELASVAQQGGGLVQAYNAAFAPCILSVNNLQFNDTKHRTTLSFTVTNESPEDITYELSNTPAGTVYTFKEDDLGAPGTYDDILDKLYTEDTASLVFESWSSVSVPGNGGSVTVHVTATDPPNVNVTRLPVWSGFVTLNGTDSSSYTIPYLGIAGSSDDTHALHTLLWRLPDPNAAPGGEPRPIIEPGRVVQIPSESPIMQVGIGMGLRRVVWDVVSAESGEALGSAPFPGYERSQRVNILQTWDGTFSNGTRVPAGKIKFVAKSLKTFGDEQDEAGWLRLESPEVDISWTD